MLLNQLYVKYNVEQEQGRRQGDKRGQSPWPQGQRPQKKPVSYLVKYLTEFYCWMGIFPAPGQSKSVDGPVQDHEWFRCPIETLSVTYKPSKEYLMIYFCPSTSVASQKGDGVTYLKRPVLDSDGQCYVPHMIYYIIPCAEWSECTKEKQ